MEKKIYNPALDPQFQEPVIDEDEMRTRPVLGDKTVPMRYIHGHFAGTSLKFLFCFPEKDAFGGRFFQHISPFPGPDEELASLDKLGEEDFIAFCLTHGAAFVECNMCSKAIFSSSDDPSIFYRSNAAAAHFCRTFAEKEYGFDYVYGYCFGGSGGGYKTMSCIENTCAYDGAVPFVIGSPVSLPNCLTVFAHGARLLRNCWPRIVDALEPGGSGNPYEGLNKDEADALHEITCMGFPPRMCCCYAVDDDGSLPVLMPGVKGMDPTYFEDFWTKPGYLGYEPEGSARRDRIHMETTLLDAGVLSAAGESSALDGRNGTDTAWTKMLTDGSHAYLRVAQVPQGDDLYLKGVDITFTSGAAMGKRLRLGSIQGDRLIPGMTYGADDVAEVIRLLKPGDGIKLDNSDYIAVQTYHRHQIPDDASFYCFDQYRDENGKPLTPQRPYVISFGFTAGGCGSVQDGCVQGKVIVVNNLMDGDFPWQADWYRRKVAQVKGEENVRLWYNDNAPHGDVNEGGDVLRVVSYLGMLRQALIDLSNWVEKGTQPAETSGYMLKDSQISLLPTPQERKGVQPLVTLTANGSVSAAVKVGESVRFSADIACPPGGGSFQSADWSFAGEAYHGEPCGDVQRRTENGCTYASVTAEHCFDAPGTYFSVVRVIAARDPADGYLRLRNLCRVRVTVTE